MSDDKQPRRGDEKRPEPRPEPIPPARKGGSEDIVRKGIDNIEPPVPRRPIPDD